MKSKQFVGLLMAGLVVVVLTVGLWEIAPELGTYPGILPAVLAAWLAAVAYGQGAPVRRLFCGGQSGRVCSTQNNFAPLLMGVYAA